MKIMKRKNFLTLKKNKHYFLTRGCDRDDQPIRIRRCDTIFVTPSFLYLNCQIKLDKSSILT
ncbi:hypothetical protein CUS52_07725 [Enterococcus faecium]|nr:hypothetical protein CUS68_09660 [Enterococcus faecium]PQG97880.1 hypothetical protein CUS52_07725 [Enterococcus faecium]